MILLIFIVMCYRGLMFYFVIVVNWFNNEKFLGDIYYGFVFCFMVFGFIFLCVYWFFCFEEFCC